MYENQATQGVAATGYRSISGLDNPNKIGPPETPSAMACLDIQEGALTELESALGALQERFSAAYRLPASNPGQTANGPSTKPIEPASSALVRRVTNSTHRIQEMIEFVRVLRNNAEV